jgi:hypothetical protein
MARYAALTTTELGAVNARRKAAGQPEIVLPGR